MSTVLRLGELAERVGGKVEGDAQVQIDSIATLDAAGPHQLSFLTNVKYRKAAQHSRAGALLVGRDPAIGPRNLLVVAEPYVALAHLLEIFHPFPVPEPGVSDDARIGRDVQLGQRVHVAPFAVIGDGAVLGDDVVVGVSCVLGQGSVLGQGTQLRPGVVLYPGTRLGARCLVHSGVVLGADGFGFATSQGKHVKVPQVGRVELGDDVEIGANTTVDRAMLGQTRIGEGSKIDDLVMIAHGVKLGPRALVAAQAGIAGSARLGSHATLAGQSGIAGHLDIGDGVIVAAKSAVFGDLPDGSFVSGIPAADHRRWKRSQAVVARLPELRQEVRDLRTRLDALERRMTGEE